MDSPIESKLWRQVLQSRRFAHAFRGLHVLRVTTRHIFFHFLCALFAVFLGFYFKISNPEWIAIVFAIGLVIISEAFNTAIEIDIDLTSPEYHPYARDTKDVAAAAVLLSAITAFIVGAIIFVPRFL
ncbi:MAG: diacylglycerol kinase family protein [bacterium]|nr:diacylglycerol kinase family protein [bacterium]